jgi:hypothetical protein
LSTTSAGKIDGNSIVISAGSLTDNRQISIRVT